jgi:hypothetical protein
MSGFEEHLWKGVVGVSILGIAATYFLFQDRMTEFFLPFLALGAVGAVLPDIDIHSSKPRRMLGTFSVIGLPIASLWLVFTDNLVKITLLEFAESTLNSFAPAVPAEVKLLVIFIGVGAVVLKFGGYVLDSVINHRGVLHSPMTGLACAGILGYAGIQHAAHVAPKVSHIGAASGLFAGFLIHLRLDGEIV